MNLLNLFAGAAVSPYDNYATALSIAFASIFFIVFVPVIVISVLYAVAMWKIYVKMGEPGWKAIVPIYNLITLYERVNINPLWILLTIFGSMIPFVGSLAVLLFGIVVIVRLCKGFDKDAGFVVGYLLLGPIFPCILAFGKSNWDPSRINMQSFEFLNKTKGPVNQNPAEPGATPNADGTNNTTPSAPAGDPWVNGEA